MAGDGNAARLHQRRRNLILPGKRRLACSVGNGGREGKVQIGASFRTAVLPSA